MNYTKGDWSVRSGFKVTSGEEQTWVADCYPYHPKHPRPRIHEAMANAHLIAASPRLYEALKAFDDYVSAGYPDNMKLKKIAVEKMEQVKAQMEGK